MNKKRGPHRSGCAPHFDWIVAQLEAGATYEEISAQLRKEHGVSLAVSSIWGFIRRRLNGLQSPDYQKLRRDNHRLEVAVTTPTSTGEDEYVQAKQRIAASMKERQSTQTYIDPTQVYPE